MEMNAWGWLLEEVVRASMSRWSLNSASLPGTSNHGIRPSPIVKRPFRQPREPQNLQPDLEGTSPLYIQPTRNNQLTELTVEMFLQRSAVAVARRAAVAPVLRRSFTTTLIRREPPSQAPAS